MLVIVDYGAGNLPSIRNMLKKAKVDSLISGSPSDILAAKKLILPGVGHFDRAMLELRSRGLEGPLNKKVTEDKIPVLGICLGLQVMSASSEEGVEKGLGWIDAKTIRFKPRDQELKIPHMGWNQISVKKESTLFASAEDKQRFYFVHAFHLVCNNRSDVLATSCYGYDFDCAVQRENIYGVQFHPEKSHRFGLSLLKNFAEKA